MSRILTFLLVAAAVSSCTSAARDASARWTGTIDTLASGQVVVHNTADPVWAPGEEWRVEEELHIGSVDGDGLRIADQRARESVEQRREAGDAGRE